MRYFSDVAALARKDLLIELRAKETVPAMLLFVLSALTIFHFAVPANASAQVSLGLLWTAIVFTALLGLTRAFVPERDLGGEEPLGACLPRDRRADRDPRVRPVLPRHRPAHARGDRPRRHRHLRR